MHAADAKDGVTPLLGLDPDSLGHASLPGMVTKLSKQRAWFDLGLEIHGRASAEPGNEQLSSLAVGDVLEVYPRSEMIRNQWKSYGNHIEMVHSLVYIDVDTWSRCLLRRRSFEGGRISLGLTPATWLENRAAKWI